MTSQIKKQYFQEYLINTGVDLNNSIDIAKYNLDIPNFMDWQNYATTSTPVIKYARPEPYYRADNGTLLESVLTYNLGYGEHNTLEYNYGSSDKQNSELKKLLGADNINKLGIDADTALLRLLIYYPGNGIPMHTDSYTAYKNKYNVTHNNIKRYFIAVSPWDWGHMLQIHDKVITNWKMGDTYEIPSTTYHLSCNFGIAPKYSLTLTGQVLEH
jgi:hypothetical protein